MFIYPTLVGKLLGTQGALLPPSYLFTGSQGTGYFPDIFENGDFFLRFQKNTHQHVAYSNRFCASLEKVVSLEAAFLDVTLRDIQKTAARETM